MEICASTVSRNIFLKVCLSTRLIGLSLVDLYLFHDLAFIKPTVRRNEPFTNKNI